MPVDDFAAFQRNLERVERELSGATAKDRLERVAKATVPDVADAVRGDLGDLSMSGWWRRKPVEITGRYRMDGGDAVIEPQPRARGPMRVLEEGRQSYAAGDRRQSGFYTSKKTSERRAKTRKVKRNVASHGGKGTWTDFTEKAVKDVPKRYDDEFQRDLGKFLTRG